MLAHCAAVARVVADLGADADAVAAAVLHAALARGVATDAALAGVLPKGVLNLVRAVTRMTDLCLLRRYTAGDGVEFLGEGVDLSSSSSSDPDAAPARFVAMLVSMSDVRALVVKLAEVLTDLRARLDVGAGGTRAARAAARAALDVHAPLANRLGVWSLKAALEDAAFAVLEPERHAEIAAAAAPDAATESVQTVLDAARDALDAAGLPNADLSGRSKHLYGLAAAMDAKHVPLSGVLDARAIRVVVETKADCYAAERAVHALWAPVDGRSKDYIRAPKANGYQSLHSVVTGPGGTPVEVQVRTRKMHFVAEYGVAAHWRYKEAAAAGLTVADGDAARVAWARWLTTWAHALSDQRARPSKGSPPASADGLHALAAAVGARATCAFPEHRASCGFADYLGAGLRAGASSCCGGEHAGAGGVLVAVVDHAGDAAAGPTVVAVAPGGTAASIAASRTPPAGHTLRVLVNNGERPGDAPLAAGDKVELFAVAEVEAGLASVPPDAEADLEVARLRLDRLMAATPEPVPAQP
jgi:hypothetical protein